jgi:hypothetical protein
MRLPDSLAYYTADEAAETLSYEKFLTTEENAVLYCKLWSFVSDERVVATKVWWAALTEAQQVALSKAPELDWNVEEV